MTRFTKTKYDRQLTARSPLGQGVIALSALVGLILIPIIGIFSFEIARYQAGVQQLEANTDSAALAGAAMLVTSRYQKPTDRLRRFEEAEKGSRKMLSKAPLPAPAASSISFSEAHLQRR